MPGTQSNRIDKWIAVLVGAASLGLFFPRVVTGSGVFFCRDGAGLHYAMWSYLKQRAAEHSWPLWFPYDGLGAPFIGSAISATFHPVSLLLLTMSVSEAMRWAAIASFGVAFGATWALARRFGCSKGSALFAALSFTYCGALVSQVSNPTFLMAGAALPLFWLGISKSAQGPPASGIALAAVAVALCAVGGDLQGALLMGAMAAPIYLAADDRWRPARCLWVVVAVGAWAVALSAAQLLPAADAFRQIDRASGLPWDEVTRWSLHPARLPEFFFGDVVHWMPGSDLPNIIRRDILHSDGLWSTTVCAGVLVALGACLAVLGGPRERRSNLILLALGILFLWLSMGAFGGLYGVAYRFIPLWSAFRFPEKLVLPASLPLVLLAGRGFTAVSALEERPRRKALLISAIGIAIPAALSGTLIWAPLSAPWHEYWVRLAAQAGIALGIATAAAILLWRRARLTSVCIPALALLQLYAVNRRAADLCTAPSWAAEPRSEVADALRRLESVPLFGQARVSVAFSRPGRLSAAERSAAEIGTQAAAALWEREALYPDHNALFDIESIGRILPFRPQRYAVWREHASQALWPLFNTRYLVTAPEDESRLGSLEATEVASVPGVDLAVMRLDRALPRAYFATPWLAVSTEEAAMLLSRPSVLSGERVVIEKAPRALPVEDALGTAGVISYRPERVEVRASVTRAGILVLNDSYFEGWKATVDGKEATIFPANLLVRGVWLEAGEHRLLFEYPMPRALRAGIWISAGTALVSLAFALAVLAGRLAGKRVDAESGGRHTAKDELSA